MVALHQHRATDAAAFDDIGIGRALPQKICINLFSLTIENINEGRTDDLALGFGVRDIDQFAQEFFAGIHPHHPQVERREEGLHLLHFVFPHEPVIHEHAGELLSDGLVQQQRRDAGIHAAAEAKYHAACTHLAADLGDLLLDEVACVPVQRHAAVLQEIQEQGAAVDAVGDFRVELDAIAPQGPILHGRHRYGGGGCRNDIAFRRLLHMIAMAHPGHLFARHPREQNAVLNLAPDGRLAIFALR